MYVKTKKKYENIKLENANNTTCPMYRIKFWKQNERWKQKNQKMKTWYKNNGGVWISFFVDYMEKGELAKECQKTINDARLKIKVVEKTGRTLKQELVWSNPFEKQKCGKKCVICEDHPKVNCKVRDVDYKIMCNGKQTVEKPVGAYEKDLMNIMMIFKRKNRTHPYISIS